MTPRIYRSQFTLFDLANGDALKKSMNLSDDELAVVIGDNITPELFEKAHKRD